MCVRRDGGGEGITVLSMGEEMCLRVTLLRIKMKPDSGVSISTDERQNVSAPLLLYYMFIESHTLLSSILVPRTLKIAF